MENLTTGGIIMGILAALSAFVIWFANAHLKPFLETGKAKDYAIWIAKIADEVTDQLVKRYPGNKWISFADQAVDDVMAVCGIEKEIAARAVDAALQRKQVNLVKETNIK